MRRFFIVCLLYILIPRTNAQVEFFNGPHVWTVSAEAPPVLNLVPFPSIILLAPQYQVNQLDISRDKKEELVKFCLDTFLICLKRNIEENHPGLICNLASEALPALDSLSIDTIFTRYQSDIFFGIDKFRPYILQKDVTVEKTDGGKKRTAEYHIIADGVFRIYSKKGLLREFPFSAGKFLQSREVLSGLLAAGPSLVKNGEQAIEVSVQAARYLADKLKPGVASFTTRTYAMKEFKNLNKLINQEKYDEALVEAEALTHNSSDKVKGRAFYMCAFLYHKLGNFSKATEMASSAKDLVSVTPGPAYYDFLYRFTEQYALRWK